MKFVLKASLELMALVKIGISLWNQNDVISLISKLSYLDLCSIEWKKIEERVLDKVSQLSLPQLLKEKEFGVIKPIGMQIFYWIKYYRRYDEWMEYQPGEFLSYLDISPSSYLPAKLCWTPQGTIERRRTAEELVKDETLRVSRRYRIACDYFLEDDIIRLWNILPENFKDYDWNYFPVISFWLDNMKNEGADHIPYKDRFYSFLHYGNKVAAKYFLQKLTPQEREDSLVELAKHEENADVLCFLLSELEEEEQITVIKNNPIDVLEYFLQWPWQSFFIGVANCMWDFLSADYYDEILVDIIDKIRDDYKDYSYQMLFREFWQKSPTALKDLFIDEIDNSLLLKCLFHFKDKENLQLILKDASFTVKEKLLYSDKFDDYLLRFIDENELDFPEFFIRECFPTKREILKFIEEFEKRLYSKKYSETEIHE